MPSSIRILIADDHLIIRQGLRLILETADDLQLVGEAADGAEAVRLAGELQPDVVLMDLRMPGMDGLTAIERLRVEQPHIAVVILTTFNEDELMMRGLRAGARGFLLKDTDRETLFNSIRAAARGETLLKPEIMARLLAYSQAPAPLGRERAGLGQAAPAAGGLALTEREREVLAGVAQRGAQQGSGGAPGDQRAHGQGPPGQHLQQAGGRFTRRGGFGGAAKGIDREVSFRVFCWLALRSSANQQKHSNTQRRTYENTHDFTWVCQRLSDRSRFGIGAGGLWDFGRGTQDPGAGERGGRRDQADLHHACPRRPLWQRGGPEKATRAGGGAPPGCARYGQWAMPLRHPARADALAGAAFRAYQPIAPLQPDRLLEDGDRLDEFGLPGCVVPLPGHTVGSVRLRLDDGSGFVGDRCRPTASPTCSGASWLIMRRCAPVTSACARCNCKRSTWATAGEP